MLTNHHYVGWKKNWRGCNAINSVGLPVTSKRGSILMKLTRNQPHRLLLQMGGQRWYSRTDTYYASDSTKSAQRFKIGRRMSRSRRTGRFLGLFWWKFIPQHETSRSDEVGHQRMIWRHGSWEARSGGFHWGSVDKRGRWGHLGDPQKGFEACTENLANLFLHHFSSWLLDDYDSTPKDIPSPINLLRWRWMAPTDTIH